MNKSKCGHNPPIAKCGLCQRAGNIEKTIQDASKIEIAYCIELGESLTIKELQKRSLPVDNVTCGKRIRHCRVHDVCTTMVPREKIHCCVGCKEFT